MAQKEPGELILHVRVEGYTLISSCESTKLATAVEQPSAGRHWNPPKKTSVAKDRVSQALSGKKNPLPMQVMQETRVKFLGWEDSPGEGSGKPTPVFLPGKCYGQRRREGYSPWGCKESDTS